MRLKRLQVCHYIFNCLIRWSHEMQIWGTAYNCSILPMIIEHYCASCKNPCCTSAKYSVAWTVSIWFPYICLLFIASLYFSSRRVIFLVFSNSNSAMHITQRKEWMGIIGMCRQKERRAGYLLLPRLSYCCENNSAKSTLGICNCHALHHQVKKNSDGGFAVSMENSD